MVDEKKYIGANIGFNPLKTYFLLPSYMTHQSFIDKKISVSGTFDFLHEGHKALLKKAFEYSYIYVGLTSDEYCAKKQDVSPYSMRYNN